MKITLVSIVLAVAGFAAQAQAQVGWWPGGGYEWEYSHEDRSYNGGGLSCGSECNRYTEGQKMGCRIPGTRNNADIYVCRQAFQPNFGWRYSHKDRNYNGGALACGTQCNRYTLGQKMGCRIPGSHNDAEIYICDAGGYWP